jgi:hypothetical protein
MSKRKLAGYCTREPNMTRGNGDEKLEVKLVRGLDNVNDSTIAILELRF